MIMAWIFMAPLAFAAGAGHGPGEIPWSTLMVQAINFALLMGGLAFALRKTVAAHFAGRAREFSELVAQAEAANTQAERAHREISDRLAQLNATAESGLNQARAEAAELRQRLLKDAETLARKLNDEAARTVQVEVDKAKAEIRNEILAAALSSSKETFAKKLGSSEQKRLQNEFAEKIQVVGR